MSPEKLRALTWYGLAALFVCMGVSLAVTRFPGGYDWGYSVISRLASIRHNPEGGRWLAGSLLTVVFLLWPVSRYLGSTQGGGGPTVAVGMLRAGLIGAGVLGLEGVLGVAFSRHLRKAHEVAALITFFGFYGGVLGLYLHRIRSEAASLVPGLLVVLPLLAAGATQTILYFDQRDLGWVSTDWRELGVPLWLSFAVWQWLAVLLLALGIGHLILTSNAKRGGDRDDHGIPKQCGGYSTSSSPLLSRSVERPMGELLPPGRERPRSTR